MINLKKIRESRKISQQRLSDDLNISRSTVAMWETEKSQPDNDMLKKLSTYFNVTVDYLLGITDFDDETNRSYCEVFTNYFKTIPLSERDTSLMLDGSLIGRIQRLDYKFTHDTIRQMCRYFRISPDYVKEDALRVSQKEKLENDTCIEPMRVPVLGYVAAGIPITAIEDVLDYEELDPNRFVSGYEYFGLKIKGDSMIPRMQSGDVVIVRHQQIVDSGDVAIVCVNGEEATCKQVQINPAGMSLISFNPAYKPMFFSKKEVIEKPVTILGKVVELRAKF